MSDCIYAFTRKHVLLDVDNAKSYEMNCHSFRCPKHGKSWRNKWRVVLKFGRTDYSNVKCLTLTTAPPCATPEQLWLASKLFWNYLRRYSSHQKIANPEFFQVLEFTTETQLPHFHVLVGMDYIPQAVISEIWASATVQAGMTKAYVVWIEKLKNPEKAVNYAISYALDGKKKMQEIPLHYRSRKVRYSKQFFNAPTREIWSNFLATTYGNEKKSVVVAYPPFDLALDTNYDEYIAKMREWYYDTHDDVSRETT